MLNDQPRNATVTCYTNCEFLIMERKDFDSILKTQMNKAKEKKIDFLRSHIPGVRNMPGDSIEKMLYYFVNETVPRNHFFLEQGEVLDGSIYFIWKGSAESYLRDPAGGLLRRGIMLEGSIFAAVPQGTRASFSVVATSSPCEILHVKPESRKHFPDCVIRSLREVLDQTISRRSNQCLPLAPMGSMFDAKTRPGAELHSRKQLPHPRSEKVPRPLSGKIPPVLTQGRMGNSRGFQTGQSRLGMTATNGFGSTAS